MEDAVPFAAMMTVECTDVAISTMSKAALTKGMSNFVSIVYYNALGTLILLPYFIFNRKKQPPLTFSFLWRIFLLGLIGSSGQILFSTGVKYSSTTLASAMGNLIPIFTFLLAVISRIEKLDVTKSSSQAKLLGAIVSVTGAFIVTLYKGPAILKTSSPSNFSHQLLLSQQSEWVFGGFLLAIVCFLAALWNIVQAATVKEYPEKMTLLFFFTFFVTIQSAIFSLIAERNPNAWRLRPGIEMIYIVCAAIFASVFRIAVHTWCLHKKGPIYVTMFRPVGIVIAVTMSVMFLGDTLHLGSVIGSVMIAMGFYSVMWGQIKEKNSLESSSQNTPLLQSHAIEEP